MTKIFLMGMPGCGKSTVAEQLSEKLELPYIDLDIVIETMKGMPISQIFEEIGEDEFRKLESMVLMSLMISNEPIILATGGGTPCFFDHMSLMKKAGKTVYLSTDLADLVRRTKQNKSRPLLQNNHQERLADLLAERRAYYEQADYIVETRGKTVAEIILEIASAVS